MKESKLEYAVQEAGRFLKRVEELRVIGHNYEVGEDRYYQGSKHTGAVRRSSMDLSRALSELRRN